MKNRVYFPSRWKFKFHVDRSKYFCNLEWSFSSWREFSNLSNSFQVPRTQPNKVSFFERRELSLNAFNHLFSSQLMSGESFLSYPSNITDAFLSGGNVNTWKCCGDVHRLCSKHDFKWRHLSRLEYSYIVSEFCKWCWVIVTTVPCSYVSRLTFCTCPSFSSMTSSTFHDLPSLTHAYDFHMSTVFTCLRLSRVNHIHMLLLYLFCTTTLYYINLLVTSLTAV